MKKRRRFPLTWLALPALAAGLEILLVEGTLTGDAPLVRLSDGLRRTLEETGSPANAAPQQMYIWKDSSGVTHIGEKPPADAPAGKVRELEMSPQAPVSPPPALEPQPAPSLPSAEAEETPSQDDGRGKEMERLHKEKAELEKQFYRARVKGDGYAQIRIRHLLEANRQALEKLAPEK